MKNIIFLIFALFIFNSCRDELITIVDEYNPPYEIKAIPGNNSISISFWSGILASDFNGFNLYVGTSASFNQPDDAIKNSYEGYPTISSSNHTRSNFTLTIPGTYNNGTLYYVTVTAYGTNELLESRYIETKIDSVIPVIPREEGASAGNTLSANGTTFGAIDTSAGLVSGSGNWKVQYFGAQTNFNTIVTITNSDSSFFDSSATYSLQGLYIFHDGGSGFAKVWITDTNGTPSYQWAYHNNATQWKGI